MKALVAIVVDSGGDGAEFLAEGRAFAQVHGVPDRDVLIYDDDLLDNDQLRAAFESDCADRRGGDYDLFAYFGHGGARGSYPGGWIALHYNQNPSSNGYVPALAAALSDCLAPGAAVVLYGCLAAAGPEPEKWERQDADPAWVAEGGFVQQLSAELCRAGVSPNSVFGHSTLGHTTRNPMVLVVDQCGQRARWVVRPYSGDWKAWVAALADPVDELRYRYPVDGIDTGPRPGPSPEPSPPFVGVLAAALCVAALLVVLWALELR